ncbi:hypothetical protein M9H77_21560 [Catharanthus roseus]|uniref:Uncharacterized protein n=1 Tax=Catharanthus roseus TaxID=4058 RepID=A0ACC0AQG6_CATRO|nr:hypothetical protein M9H77_21560 [Catharanthus roseus]
MARIDSNQENIPQIDSSILISTFLDDSQLEYCDDERLRVVIQSLEAAITPISINIDQVEDTTMVFDEEEQKIYSPFESSNDDLDLISWIDMEIFSPSSSSSSSSSSGDEISWYEQVSGDDELDMSYMIEYDAVCKDFLEISPMEMEDHIYSSLWQETYDLQDFETCKFHS